MTSILPAARIFHWLTNPMKVTILHLDLGIGGAEQLVVNVGTVMQELGHEVIMLTSHHDPNHCFEETKPNGNLGHTIRVHGDWLPRQVFGKLTAFCAILRMIYLAIIVVLFYLKTTDVVILDGVSAPIPLLRLFNVKVLFYCHFPDLLLCYERGSIWKRAYRYVVDGIEEWTTGCASLVLVNSKFTAQIYADTFTKLASRSQPQVLYPVVKELADEELPLEPKKLTPYCAGYDDVFLSLNRYERKKSIELAIKAFHYFKAQPKHANYKNKKVLLVVAGGYDLRVEENVQYLEELKTVCASCDLKYKFLSTAGEEHTQTGSEKRNFATQGVDVIFRISIPSAERTALLMQSTGLLYTPDREHFGIVPIEAMFLQVPVIAVNSGGPKETVLNGHTGYLCEQNAEEFGTAMQKLLEAKRASHSSSASASTMGQQARAHVKANFSFQSMKTKLGQILEQVQQLP